MEKLAIRPNTPVQIALKYAGGKLVDGHYGQQVYFSLAMPPDTCLYMDLEPAAVVNGLEPRAGEAFWIQKVSDGRKGSKPTWDAWFDRDRKTQLATDLKTSLADVDRQLSRITGAKTGAPAPVSAERTQPNAALATNGTAPTKLEHALKTVVAALHATNEYAKTLGYAMPQFGADEITRLTNTLLINSNGGPR